MKKHPNAQSAVSAIQSGQRVFVHGGAAMPHALIRGLSERASQLQNVELIHLHVEGEVPYVIGAARKSFKVANLFVGANLRKHLDYETVDYLPCFLSEIPQLFRSRRRPLDVALVHVSVPDSHGFCSLGVSVDVAKAAIDSATLIIAQINPRMPRVHGDGIIHTSQIHHCIEVDEALPECESRPPSAEDQRIGELVASLVEDGSTLQAGIGAIPDAVVSCLTNHKHLGVHTEMWSDGTLKLLKKGIVDNSLKRGHPGKTVSSFVMGSQAVYDFVHDNPSVIQLDAAYVNSPAVISRNPKVVAINSAVEIDLTGQVCADSIGNRIISGVGGQMDFMRGASLSPGGKPIIALSSRTAKGASRLVPFLRQGAGVVTTRAHVHFVVTEYGIADLFGKTLNERAQSLIRLAHPEDRTDLMKQWREHHLT